MKMSKETGGISRKKLYLMLLCSFLALQAAGQQTTFSSDTTHIDSTENETSALLQKLIKDIEAENPEAAPVELEIDGLIVDETVSRAGRNFYQLFYNQWQPPPKASNFSILISEKPGRGIGTIIMVEVNDNKVIETPLQPRYDIIEAIAEQSVRSIYNYLLNYEQIQRQLSGDDLSGSGIF